MRPLRIHAVRVEHSESEHLMPLNTLSRTSILHILVVLFVVYVTLMRISNGLVPDL